MGNCAERLVEYQLADAISFEDHPKVRERKEQGVSDLKRVDGSFEVLVLNDYRDNGLEVVVNESVKVISFAEHGKKESQKEKVGSAAFNLEYEHSYTDAELYDDIVSYLGEYRLKVPKFEYEYVIGVDPENLEEGVGLCDPHRRELMRVKSQRALEERRQLGKPTHREEAEDYALQFIDAQFKDAQVGDTLLWGSPPGPKEEGYGDYGFVFYGRVFNQTGLQGEEEKRVAMQAIRVESPRLAQYNAFFNEFIEVPIDFSHADQFLASPFVLSVIPEKLLDSALKKHFDFEISQQDQLVFERVIDEMDDVIHQFVAGHKEMTTEEKLRAFYSIENYALVLQEGIRAEIETSGKVVFVDRSRIKKKQLQDILHRFGYAPPRVSGSCGSTGGSSNPLEALESNLPMNRMRTLLKALGIEIDEGFQCPKCLVRAGGPVGDKCPNCSMTKEEFAKQAKSMGVEVCE